LDINLNNQNDNNEDLFIKKDKKNFLTHSVTVVLLILIFAATSVGIYLPIRNAYFPIEDNAKVYLESNDFIYNLSSLTRNLQQSINKTNDGYDDRYVNVKSVKYKFNGTINQSLGSVHESEKTDRVTEVKEKVETTTKVEEGTNADETILERKSLSNMSDITDNALQKEIEDSQFYMRASFDENGNPEIESSLGSKFNKDLFINRLTYSNEESLKEYSNLEVLYIVPQDFESYNDIFTSRMKDEIAMKNYVMLILAIGMTSCCTFVGFLKFSISIAFNKSVLNE